MLNGSRRSAKLGRQTVGFPSNGPDGQAGLPGGGELTLVGADEEIGFPHLRGGDVQRVGGTQG